jgi:hypothetical protein
MIIVSNLLYEIKSLSSDTAGEAIGFLVEVIFFMALISIVLLIKKPPFTINFLSLIIV